MHVAASNLVLASHRFRAWLLLAIALNVILIAGRTLLYSPLWTQPGAVTYVLEPLVLLLVYAVVVVWTTRNTNPDHRVALHQGVQIGLVTGAMWIVNLTLETFASLSGLGVVATAPFLLGAFALWGVAGFRSARRTGSVPLGILGAVWSAMICVLMTICFGFVLTYTSLPHLAHQLAGDPDYLHSHWHDLRAFAIANSFDSAFSHLLGGLLVAAAAGMIGSIFGLFVKESGR